MEYTPGPWEATKEEGADEFWFPNGYWEVGPKGSDSSRGSISS